MNVVWLPNDSVTRSHAVFADDVRDFTVNTHAVATRTLCDRGHGIFLLPADRVRGVLPAKCKRCLTLAGPATQTDTPVSTYCPTCGANWDPIEAARREQ